MVLIREATKMFKVGKRNFYHKHKTYVILIFLFILNLVVFKSVKSENIYFKYRAINPSQEKTQTITVKKYLPEEVNPSDIVSLSDLKLEYDTAISRYYVYKEEVPLKPKEIRTFEVEVLDVWVVPEEEILEYKKQTNITLDYLIDTSYGVRAKEIAGTIYARLDKILTSQSDQELSRELHIGLYRENLIVIANIEEDISKMEKLLVKAGGPNAPEMLEDKKVISDSPSKNMAWIVIFSIIIFSVLLSGVLFFAWHSQVKITKDTLIAAKKASFPDEK